MFEGYEVCNNEGLSPFGRTQSLSCWCILKIKFMAHKNQRKKWQEEILKPSLVYSPTCLRVNFIKCFQ